jgi:hypothetical protein
LNHRIIQFETQSGRRLGVVDGDVVHDLTSAEPAVERVCDAFELAQDAGQSLTKVLGSLAAAASMRHPYAALLANRRLADGPVLRPPLDHADPHRVLVSGTGLTHLGSVQSRDQMHATESVNIAGAAETPLTDSKKMFQIGLGGGKPAAGVRGSAPEWFYKGNGSMLRGPHESLAIPPFAEDGGEEPEIVGCYVIDRRGVPRRLGFALGNEWSDHATESVNYLYLAPSKVRQCAIGPELVTDCEFQHIELRCQVRRRGELIYDSGPLASGERNMCHSLANLEDHHFKVPEHRIPGDVHLHFFGTSKLSFHERDWQYADGDEIRIEAPGFSAPLVNSVSRLAEPDVAPVRVAPA